MLSFRGAKFAKWVVVKIMVPFLGPYYNTAPIWGTPKGILILTTTHTSLGPANPNRESSKPSAPRSPKDWHQTLRACLS